MTEFLAAVRCSDRRPHVLITICLLAHRHRHPHAQHAHSHTHLLTHLLIQLSLPHQKQSGAVCGRLTGGVTFTYYHRGLIYRVRSHCTCSPCRCSRATPRPWWRPSRPSPLSPHCPSLSTMQWVRASSPSHTLSTTGEPLAHIIASLCIVWIVYIVYMRLLLSPSPALWLTSLLHHIRHPLLLSPSPALWLTSLSVSYLMSSHTVC